MAWVAGLLEGEGCFYMILSPHPRVQVRCSMTDEDVIRRLHSLTGRGRVRGPFLTKAFPSAKPQWLWTLGRNDGLEDFLRELLPYMGERRSAKIAEILTAFEAWPARRGPRHGTRQMYEKHKCRCESCRASNAARGVTQRARRRSVQQQ